MFRRKLMVLAAFTITIPLVLTGCRGQASDAVQAPPSGKASASAVSDDEIRRLLVGSWFHEGKSLEEGTMRYVADGTVSGTSRITSGTLEYAGTWSVADGIIEEKITRSSNNELLPVGTTSRDRVLALDGDMLQSEVVSVEIGPVDPTSAVAKAGVYRDVETQSVGKRITKRRAGD